MNTGLLNSGKRLALFGAALVLILSLSSCFWRSSPPPPAAAPTPVPEATVKPRPQVTSVTASTAGFFEDYYVILDATIRNEGAEGVVIVIASITQAGNTSTKQIPVSLRKGGSQVVRFVFPIKWKGGEWTPKVTTEVP